MPEYGLVFARVRVNLHRVKIQIQPVTRFYLQHKCCFINRCLSNVINT